MIRDDIEAVSFQRQGTGYPIVAKVGQSLFAGEIVRIDFSEETKICRLYHENGSMTILANSENLILRTKSTEEDLDKCMWRSLKGYIG